MKSPNFEFPTQSRVLLYLCDCSFSKKRYQTLRRSAVPGKAAKTGGVWVEKEEENERTGDSCTRVVTNLIPGATRSELTQRRLSSRRRVVSPSREDKFSGE